MEPLSRRRFLGAGLAGVAGASVGGADARVRAPQRVGAETPADLVGAYFSNGAAAGRIGALYLQLVPAEASEAALLAALAPTGEDPTQWWASTDDAALKDEVRARAHADFETPDVVDLGGWQLARTEARLAALWALTHP
jgi:hypothetical protein